MVDLTILKAAVSKAGYLVFTAENGTDALEIARAQIPDLIVLDIMMPDMDGTEVASTLKKDPKTRAIPIILLSSSVPAQKERGNLNKDFVSYLSKPLNRDKLLSEIRRCLVKKVSPPIL